MLREKMVMIIRHIFANKLKENMRIKAAAEIRLVAYDVALDVSAGDRWDDAKSNRWKATLMRFLSNGRDGGAWADDWLI